MNKRTLAERMAEEFGSTDKAERAIEAVLSAILRGAKDEGRVTITGFGTFTRERKAPHKRRNPQTGGTIKVGVTYHLHFKQGAGARKLMEKRGKLPDGNIIAKAPKGTYTPVSPGAKKGGVKPPRTIEQINNEQDNAE